MSTAAPLAPADLTITEQESVARRAALALIYRFCRRSISPTLIYRSGIERLIQRLKVRPRP